LICKFSRLPWVIALSLPIYCIASLSTWALESHGVIPKWAEAIYAALFVVPTLVLSKPWYPLLSQCGLMQGEWVRFPSPLGVILVFGFYTLVAVVAGMLFSWLSGWGHR